MTRPLVATKLYVPRLRRGLVARPRLVDRLGGDGRLTLVSAPAGFGKTTLLASWLARPPTDDRRVAWLSLDASDDDPVSFWTGVVTALRRRRAGRRRRAAGAAARAARVDRRGGDRAAQRARRGARRGVAGARRLPPGRATRRSRRGLTFLVEHLPPHVHVVLSTRADPDLPLARWRVRGELVEIRAADLRFSTERGRRLPRRGDRRAAHRRAGAGPRGPHRGVDRRPAARRHLAAGAATTSRPSSPGSPATTATSSTTSSRRCSPTSRSRCATSCCAPRCSTGSPRRCATPCSTATAPAPMLPTLERANLFLVALDDRREWYRYHQLFADVLRARLLGEQPDLVPVLHRRASRWYEEHDLPDEAIGTRWRRATSTGRPSSWSRPCPRSGASGARPWCRAGSPPCPTTPCGAARCSASSPPPCDDRRRPRRRRAAARRRGGRARRGGGGRHPALARDRGAAHPAVDDRHVPGVTGAGPRATSRARPARPARPRPRRAPDDHLARGGAAGFLGLTAWARGDVDQALETFGQAVDEPARGRQPRRRAERHGGARRPVARGRAAGDGPRALRPGAAGGRGATARRWPGRRPSCTWRWPSSTSRRTTSTPPGSTWRRPATWSARAPVNESHFRLLRGRAPARRRRGRPARRGRPPRPGGAALPPRLLPRRAAGARPMRARLRVRQGVLAAAADWARERGVSRSRMPRSTCASTTT